MPSPPRRTLSWNTPRKERATHTRLSRDESDARDRRLLAAGDLEALVAYYWDPVLAWIHATAPVSSGEAEDIRQEVFMRVTREVTSGLQYRLPFGAAIFNIAGWTTKGYVQRAARRSEHELAVGDDDRDIEATDATATYALDQVGQDEDVTRLFNDLPDRERRLMTLVYLDGHTLAEAAQEMGVTGNNAHQIHHRAKQKLMHVIAGAPA